MPELRLGHGILVSQNAIEMLVRRAGVKGLPGNRRPRPTPWIPAVVATGETTRHLERVL